MNGCDDLFVVWDVILGFIRVVMVGKDLYMLVVVIDGIVFDWIVWIIFVILGLNVWFGDDILMLYFFL